jgi:protease-4
MLILLLTFIFAVQSLVFLSTFLDSYSNFENLAPGKKIGVVSVNGIIAGIDEQIRQLEIFEDRSSIKAILLEINSPGGMVGPSQELSETVKRISDSGKPVVASVRSVGASGAYYIASSADTIVSNPGALIGSIGVIMEFMRVEEMMDKIGIDYEVVKSGRFKDLGSPFREMTADERKVIGELIKDVYEQFINHILENRKGLSREELEPLADGRVFTGRQALELNLIDALGTRRDAIKIAARAAGIEDEPLTVNLERKSFELFKSFTQLSSVFGRWSSGQQAGFRLLYMMPGGGEKID